MTGAVLGLSVVVWFVTLVIVEGEIFRPLRERIEEWAATHGTRNGDYRDRLAYGFHCHMCCGVWVGLLGAGLTPYRPISSTLPAVSWFLSGLLYKGVAHLILALNHLITRTNKQED